MALTIFKDTFGKARKQRLSKVQNTEAVYEHAATTLAAIQTLVDTLRGPGGVKYEVGFATGATAATSENLKRIVVTYEPIFDKSLTIATACTVMTGLVLHEVGHTLVTFRHTDLFKARFGIQGDQEWGRDSEGNYSHTVKFDRLAYHLLNIAEDAALEAYMSRRLPIAVDCFPTMLQWVAIKSGMVGWFGKWNEADPMKKRVDFVLWATRYPWTARWSADPVTRAERIWWRDWVRSYAGLDIDDGAGKVAAIEAALDRLRDPERTEEDLPDDDEQDIDEPAPPPVDDDESEDDEDGDDDGDADDDESDEDEDEDGDGDEPGDDDGDDADDDETDDGDETEPGDEQGEDEGDGGSDADDDETDGEDGEGEGNGDGDADDDETEPGEGNGNGGLSSDEPPEDWDEDDDGEGGGKPGEGNPVDTDDEPTGEGNETESGEGKVDEREGERKDRSTTQHPTDFTEEDERQSNKFDADTKPRQYGAGRRLQDKVDAEKTLVRTDTGKYGSAKIEVKTIENRFNRY